MLALGCGLVASIGITQVMSSKGSDQNEGNDQGAIYVALQDIPTGDLITPEMLKLEPWPKDKIPPGALTTLEDVESRRPKTKIFAGEAMLDNKLLSKGHSTTGVADQIPPGYRVIAVRVDDESGIADMVLPGDRVDLLLFTEAGRNGAQTATCVRTILQDIKVKAVNDMYSLETAEPGQSINAKTVSFEVTLSQAELIVLATKLGKLQLALRSHEDKAKAEIEPVFPHELGDGEPASREDEELRRLPLADNNPGSVGSSLLATATAESVQPETWTIQLIENDVIRNVMLESTADPSGDDSASSGPSLWKTTFAQGPAAFPAVHDDLEPSTAGVSDGPASDGTDGQDQETEPENGEMEEPLEED
jgi:pilus assembly protein CpaB